MAKSVTYEIELLNSPANRAALKALEDSVRASVAGIESSINRIGIAAQSSSRISASIGSGGPTLGGGPALGVSSVPDYSRQLEALDKFKRETESRFSDAGKDGLAAFKNSLGGLDEDLKRSGEKSAKKFKQGFTSSIGELSGLSGADLRTLLGADDNDVLRLAEETADTYRDGLKKRLSEDLGVGGGQADFLFGAKGGPDLAGQQADFQGGQAAALDNIGGMVDKLDELDAASESTRQSMSRNFREITEKSEQAASGIGQMAAGISFLFADSKDAKKLVDSLLAIKGTADVVLGGFKSLSAGLQIFSLFGDRSEANAKKQKQQAEATKLAGQAASEYIKWLDREGVALEKVTNGNKEHAAALREVAAAADRATKEEAELLAQQSRGDRGLGGRVAGRVGGGRRGGVGGIIASAGSMFGGAAIDQLSGGGLMGQLGNLGLDKILGRVAGGGAAGTGGAASALASPAVLAAVAAAAAAAAGKLGFDIVRGGGTIDPKSGSGKVLGAVGSNAIGGSVDKFLGLDTPAARLVDSFEALDKAVKNRAKVEDNVAQEQLTADLAMIERQGRQQMSDFRSGAAADVRSLRVQNGDMTASKAAGISGAEAAKDLADQMKIVQDYQAGILSDEKLYVSALDRANESYVKLSEAQKGLIAGVQQESAERERLNNSSIAAAEKRLGLLDRERDFFRTTEEKLEAAAQRFARLSEEDKLATVNAQKVAQQGGKLSRRQKELLEGTNLGAEREAVKRQDLAEAQKAGFFDIFGSFEKSQLQGSFGRQRELDSIQNQANQITSGSGTVKEQERALRALDRRQDRLGLDQSEAGRRTGFSQNSVDRSIQAQQQATRVEVQNRQQFHIVNKINTEEMVRPLIALINKNNAEQRIIMQKLVDENSRTQKANFVKSANDAAIAARNAKNAS